MGKSIEVPYGYGDILSVTGSGAKVILWMRDGNGIVRGLPLDLTDPANPVVSKDEIVVRRKTEGQVRKKKLPPVGAPLPANLGSTRP
jgi:hypothetical protein